MSSDAERGRQAAQDLWRLGLDQIEIDDPLTPEFAQAALAELDLLQKGTPGVLREVLQGAQMSAEQLNVESFHGLIETVQNADDLRASEVRVAITESGKQRRLLIVHNGERVHLDHVIAMTLAFVSTKRDDPRAKGRFGIGLKTLGRLADVLTVHCAPYDFNIEGNHVHAADRAGIIQGFYDPASTETLLDLRLRERFDANEFQTWFASLGPESLIFLDTVRSLRLVSIGNAKGLIHHELTEVVTDTLNLPGISEPCQRTILHASGSSRSWTRYEIEWKMPPHLQRRFKARNDTTPMAIALPSEKDSGQIYAGLPLGAVTHLPFRMNAQFDIDVARRGIQHEPLNTWLFERLADLTASVALYRLADDPESAWRAIPVKSEQTFPGDAWIAERIAEFVESIQTCVRRRSRILIAGKEHRLSILAYETQALDGLLTQRDIQALRKGLTLLPDAARDRDARWRVVLDDIGTATLIDVLEGLGLLEQEDDDLGPRDVRWFIKLARAAIEADLGDTLSSLRSIIAADGSRIAPPMVHDGELLLRSAQNDSLAFRLRLARVIDPVYLSQWRDAVIVRKWLEEEGVLKETVDSESTLRALASHEWEDQPPHIGDDDLRLMRDAFAALDRDLQEELGLKIGQRIEVDVQRWEGSKRITSAQRPADAYLPASIEGRKDGWSKAAGRAEGVSWIHPRYEEVLRQPRSSSESKSRPLGARTFFALFGAEIAPRLITSSYVETRHGDPATPINSLYLVAPQIDALRGLERAATHVRGDQLSPDLLAALKDIQRERGLTARRERARALLNTLEREWDRLYAPHTTAEAVWSDRTWRYAGEIPASWLASAIYEPWLTSENGKKRAPSELAVRTPATEAIYGVDPNFFASGLDERDATSATIRALAIKTDPPVSEMVDELTMLRDKSGAVDDRSVMVRYAAIATNCKKTDIRSDDMVGDLPLRRLRGRFGTQRSKPGLIYANGSWLAPSAVFLGAPIFGRHRAFVSEKSAGAPLWRALKVHPPSITDCLDVLGEIARGIPDDHDEQTLVNIYQYLESHLQIATGRDLIRLRNVPLWNGTVWQTDRPIYVIAHDDVAEALSSHIPIWKIPVAQAAVSRLIGAVGATLLMEDQFDPVVHEHAFVAGATLQQQFVAAAKLLRDWLTRRDPSLFQALSTSWEELDHARIAIDPQLQIELRLHRRTPVSVRARAHLTRTPLAFYFSDTEAPGEDEGGRAIASLFTEGDHDKVALAWKDLWRKAAKGERGTTTLVQDRDDGQALVSLFEQAKGSIPFARRAKSKQARETAKIDGVAESSLPVRRLKRIEDLSEKVVDLADGNNEPAAKRSRRRGLRGDIPVGRGIGDSKPAPQTAPRAYSDEDKEHLALQILQLAINGDSAELRDYHHLRGIGADALDKLRRFFEIKASYGEMPDDVTLLANQVERAVSEGDKFFLAVIGGLEKGYDTVVKILPNPLRTLKPKPNTSVTLTGVRECKALTVWLSRPGAGATDEEISG